MSVQLTTIYMLQYFAPCILFLSHCEQALLPPLRSCMPCGGGLIVFNMLVVCWQTDALRWLMTQQQCWYDRVEDKYYNPTSDAYLSMLVKEVKPWVDEHYQTLTDREHTALMGSSMGGLISLYALQKYPDVSRQRSLLLLLWVKLKVVVHCAAVCEQAFAHR